MTKSYSTKRALLTSSLALLLCFAMLLGTTFAWFTDNVSTTNNIITAGNLDVELYYQNDEVTTWEKVDANTNVFKEDTLWEPGHVEVVKLKVVNAGTLDLEYQLGVNIASETGSVNVAGVEFKLSDYIKYAIIEGDKTYSNSASAAAAAEADKTANKLNVAYDSGVINLNDGAEKIVTLVVYMPAKVGNEANYGKNEAIPTINLGINLYSTQLNSEEDSFGSDYDENAKYDKPVEVASVDNLKTALANGDNVVLANDIALTSTLMAKKDAVIDLNGNTITAPSNGVMFQSQSNAAPSMIITSSVAGAEINVSGGDTSVLLGYGSTEISNVTINVTGCDNYSPNPFNVYGDLTLGKGTVVNVDYLGTALISNNGAVAIDIDGAEINVGTFKTNGTAIITLNQASTLKMKNTDIKIDNFVLSPFGGDSLVSKVDGVTIEGCTFDVTDSNGKDCTFVAKEGKYRLVQN